MASLNNRAVSDNDPWEIFHNGFLGMKGARCRARRRA